MNKIFLILFCATVLALWFFYFNTRPAAQSKKIGMVIPLQHEALDQIIQGFSSEIEMLLGEHVVLEVHNALGDINLQKSAINKLLNDDVALLVPVGTATAQMAINLAGKKQPLLFLAANIAPHSPSAEAKAGLMGIIDEVAPERLLEFIRTALPDVKRLALIYSSNDKMPDEAQAFSHAAEQADLSVQKLMIQNLADLYTLAPQLDSQIQAMVILKDNLVVSSVTVLVQQAQKLGIPLISADEGSNSKGGAVALGVIESDIGRQGARLAAAFFKRELISEPIQYLDKLKVFINTQACLSQNVDVAAVLKAAAAHNYEVVKR